LTNAHNDDLETLALRLNLMDERQKLIAERQSMTIARVDQAIVRLDTLIDAIAELAVAFRDHSHNGGDD
jgi:hypothetical protein